MAVRFFYNLLFLIEVTQPGLTLPATGWSEYPAHSGNDLPDRLCNHAGHRGGSTGELLSPPDRIAPKGGQNQTFKVATSGFLIISALGISAGIFAATMGMWLPTL